MVNGGGITITVSCSSITKLPILFVSPLLQLVDVRNKVIFVSHNTFNLWVMVNGNMGNGNMVNGNMGNGGGIIITVSYGSIT